MSGFPPNTDLLIAVRHFIADQSVGRARLQSSLALKVEGLLHLQLRDAARNALRAPPADIHLVLEGLRELMRAIGAEATARHQAEFPREDPPAPLPARTVALQTKRPPTLRAPRDVPPARLPY